MDNTQFPPVPSTATQNQPGTASPMQTGSTATVPTSPTVPNPVVPRPLNPNAQAPLPVPPQPPQPPQPLSPTSPTPPVPSSSPEPTVTNPIATPPPTPIAPTPKRKIPRIIAVVIVLLLLAGGGAFAFKYFQKPAVAPADENLVQQIPESSDEAMVVDEISGWESHTVSELGLELSYPEDAIFSANSGNLIGIGTDYQGPSLVTISKYGPTQALDSEFFDGYSLTIVKIGLKGESLEQIAQNHIQSSTTEFGQDFVVQPIKPISVGQKQGLTYTVRGLGEYTHILLPNDEGSFILVTYSVPDPTDQGYQKIVDQILSTFEFVDSATVTESGWKNYTNTTYGFSIKYPTTIPKYQGEWEVVEYGSTIGFRPNTIREDSIWGVTIHQNATVESIATASGSQFPDRRQETQAISVNGKPATLITVTTSQDPVWIAKTVVIGDGNTLFSISNGAIEIPEFEEFYQSFAFTQ